VVRVIDGDTVVTRLMVFPDEVHGVSVRLRGIDAPEVHSTDACERHWGTKARDWLRRRLPSGAQVRVDELGLGSFAGRVIGRVLVNGKDVGEQEVAAGLAVHYEPGQARHLWPACAKNGGS